MIQTLEQTYHLFDHIHFYLDYKYHIRGGLKGINLDANNNLTNSLFSYKLDYEEDGTYYDGNIRNQYWKSNIDGIQRAYQYNYDGASRITAATYGSTKAGENYALNNVNYDANGNIKTLSRNGATNTNYTSFGNVDNLTYTYQTNSNKLLKIQDATIGNPDLGDFRDGTNTDNDYEYWEDGSLKKDKNKKIASITYNYLKLPKTITFDNGRTITTQYDAQGSKLKKIDSNGETTDYEEDEIYVNGSLYQISHDEGRINAQGQYEYNITDHLGNLRVSLKDSAGIAVPLQSLFYDPWGLSMKGMAITRNPANFNKFQFLNRETQFETGYIDLMHRQFAPQTGRFTSQDPVIEGQEHLSLYQYSYNNPILRSDPDGDCPFCPAIPFLPEIGAGAIAVGEYIAGSTLGLGVGAGLTKLANSGVLAWRK
ncbi:RHS repeat domain-containing protein [Flectobacillus major]|uniref:RHS repeat domain-containing protein n=1 Tax=Flectobacillus major TaxID=103 RepID=UPI00041BA894|nr:RHS repeat-associated core domain-containing protein [Flectobacillus major]